MTALILTQAQQEALESSGDNLWLVRFTNGNTMKALVRRGLLESRPSGRQWPLYRITPAGEALRNKLKDA